jgi:hypothetical protein
MDIPNDYSNQQRKRDKLDDGVREHGETVQDLQGISGLDYTASNPNIQNT